MCCTYANGLGYRVIGVDTGDDKAAMCKELGAEHFVDFMKTKETAKQVMEITGSGAHAVIGCGGSQASYNGAVDYLKKTGTLVCVGLPPAGSLVGGAPFQMATRKLTITGSLVASLDELEGAMDLAARHKIKPYITVYPWSRFAEYVAACVCAP
jgi:propanol-preferring alcohol dehydrogenase